MKKIVVRRNRGHRIGVRVLSVSAMIMLVCTWVFWGRCDGLLGLLCGVMAAVVVSLDRFFGGWKVVLSTAGIEWKGTVRPWSQIERVWEDWTHGDQGAIHIQFRDGRTLHLRMIEENMGKARKMICARCSIEDRT